MLPDDEVFGVQRGSSPRCLELQILVSLNFPLPNFDPKLKFSSDNPKTAFKLHPIPSYD